VLLFLCPLGIVEKYFITKAPQLNNFQIQQGRRNGENTKILRQDLQD
jgi:hypothetical protein